MSSIAVPKVRQRNHSLTCKVSTSFQGLTRACSETDSLDSDPNIRMIALFDNEEVLSVTQSHYILASVFMFL